ncbi:hypothetical protein NG799_04935 [Laspinema sp. D1]|uniref:Uncharacterized protein n=1 Tax=Laspinema palackyanum D2a TaxID=2953684 RepID=A0ABT2MLQ5_9CYAN|nr:hypothetical protein [Laspinema sp. D2a]
MTGASKSRTKKCTSGPLPLARGGLGWGPLDWRKQVKSNVWVEGVGGDWRKQVTKKEVSTPSIQALKPERLREVAIATSRKPHPNPPLAKGRGPEVLRSPLR